MKIKAIVGGIFGVFNPFSDDFSLISGVFMVSGAVMSASIPNSVKNFGKAISLVICDSVNDDHQELCKNYTDNFVQHSTYIAGAVAAIGDVYLLHLILH